MPARARYLNANDVSVVFTMMDKDGSGMLNGAEVAAMFETICGCPVQVSNAKDSYSLNDFIKAVEDTTARYPRFNVAANLMKYLKENKPEDADPDALSLGNCTKLFSVLDADSTGELDLMELFKMFKFMNIRVPALIEAFQETGNVTSAEELQTLVKSMDEKFPALNIDEKVVEFIAQTAENGGGKPDTASAEDPPEPPADPVTGTKKALLVGINYLGTSNELGGCINDVRNQLKVLTENYEFSEDNILLLTEDQGDDSKLPTAENIRAGFTWLFDGVSEGDELVFHYSGHGSQMSDKTGSEPDGKNECICPLDCQKGWPDYIILDNEIFNTFYQGLPDGVKCVCIFDCCHSGTISDLQCTKAFTLEPEDQARWMDPPEDVAAELAELESKEPGEATREVADRDASNSAKQLWTFSGCQDNQTSADATIGGVRQGALTWGFIKALTELGWKTPYVDLLTATKKNLAGKYTQVPGLSTTCNENFNHWYLEKE